MAFIESLRSFRRPALCHRGRLLARSRASGAGGPRSFSRGAAAERMGMRQFVRSSLWGLRPLLSYEVAI
eukprot:5780894-Pyramimonas_sp.AAC.1